MVFGWKWRETTEKTTFQAGVWLCVRRLAWHAGGSGLNSQPPREKVSSKGHCCNFFPTIHVFVLLRPHFLSTTILYDLKSYCQFVYQKESQFTPTSASCVSASCVSSTHLWHHLIKLSLQGAVLLLQLLVLEEGSLQPGLQPQHVLLLLLAGLTGRLTVLYHPLLSPQHSNLGSYTESSDWFVATSKFQNLTDFSSYFSTTLVS